MPWATPLWASRALCAAVRMSAAELLRPEELRRALRYLPALDASRRFVST
jgi:hypothetical protein